MSETLSATVERFLDYLKVERNYSPQTLIRYRHDLNRLVEYATARNVAGWTALRSDALRNFIAGEHRAGIAPKTLPLMSNASPSRSRLLTVMSSLPSLPRNFI